MKRSLRQSIYVMTAETSPVLRKIGIAADPARRIASVAVGCPYPVRLDYCSHRTDIAYEIERVAHRHFQDRRVRGEWFDVPLAEVVGYLRRFGLGPSGQPMARRPNDTGGVAEWRAVFGFTLGVAARELRVTTAAISRAETGGYVAGSMELALRLTTARLCAKPEYADRQDAALAVLDRHVGLWMQKRNERDLAAQERRAREYTGPYGNIRQVE